MDADLAIAAEYYKKRHLHVRTAKRQNLGTPTSPCPKPVDNVLPCPRYKLVVSAEICARCKSDPEFKKRLDEWAGGPGGAGYSRQDAPVSEHTVDPGAWGRFLCAIFDEWVRRDVGRVFVIRFEAALAASGSGGESNGETN